MRLFYSIIQCMIVLLVLSSCDTSTNTTPEDQNVTITANFKGPLYAGNYYKGYLPATGYVLWIKDSNGNFVKTIHVTKGIVEVGVYGAHTDHLPEWEKSSGVSIDTTVAKKEDAFIPEEFDGITSASPTFGSALADTTVTLVWDFTDESGTKVPKGTYSYHFEAGNISKDSVDTGESIVTVINETTSGTIQYGSGTATAANPTNNITSLTAQVSQ